MATSLWWDSNYLYRRNISITPVGTLPVGHPVEVDVDLATTLDQGKLRSDRADLEVLRFSSGATPAWSVVARQLTNIPSNKVRVRFLLTGSISSAQPESEYYIYYGNRNLVSPPSRPSFSDNLWPISVLADNSSISYTRLTEHWKKDSDLYVSEVARAQASLEFEGVSVRILATTYPEGAKAEVQINDEQWEEVDLFSLTTLPDTAVFTKTGLTSGTHRIRYRVTGTKNPSAQGNKVNLKSIDFVRPATLTGLSEETFFDLAWSASTGGS